MNDNPINEANQIASCSVKHASLRSSVRPVIEHLYFNECIKGDFPKVFYGLKVLLPYLTTSAYNNLVADTKNDEFCYQHSYLSNNQLKNQHLKTISDLQISSFAEDLTHVSKRIFRR